MGNLQEKIKACKDNYYSSNFNNFQLSGKEIDFRCGIHASSANKNVQLRDQSSIG
jgi:hypothetical protein